MENFDKFFEEAKMDEPKPIIFPLWIVILVLLNSIIAIVFSIYRKEVVNAICAVLIAAIWTVVLVLRLGYKEKKAT